MLNGAGKSRYEYNYTADKWKWPGTDARPSLKFGSGIEGPETMTTSTSLNLAQSDGALSSQQLSLPTGPLGLVRHGASGRTRIASGTPSN